MKPNTDYRLIHLMRTISNFHKEFWHKLAPAFFRLITRIQNDHTTPNMNSAYSARPWPKDERKSLHLSKYLTEETEFIF